MKVFIATLSAIVLCALSAQFPRETLVGTMTTSFGVRFQDRTPGGNAGAAVTGVGDVDGDQIQDFAVSVPLAPSVMFSATNVGLVYIVYGVQNSSVASTVWGTDKNLSSFPANRVRLLDGYWPNTKAGWSIAAGDVNSDGLSDVIIGASPYNSFQGRVIIVFGKTRASATSPLSMYTPDGVSVSVFAGDTGSNFGVSVSTGDFDGDTISDILVGADAVNGVAGRSYIIFGHTGPWSTTEVAAPNIGVSVPGVLMDGPAASDSGYSVSTAGDVNGDGVEDVLIGASRAGLNTTRPQCGMAFIVFGRNRSSWKLAYDLASLTLPDGVKIYGAVSYDYLGWSVSGGFDFNLDGIGDIILGAYQADPMMKSGAGQSYVILGHTTWTSSVFDLISDNNAANSVKFFGENIDDGSGYCVRGLRDINGDGLDDVVIGAHYWGSSPAAAGRAYVVFGQRRGWPWPFQLSSLNGTNGFILSGSTATEWVGIACGSAGDVNHDGLGDILIGSTGWSSYRGRSALVYGSRYPLHCQTMDGNFLCLNCDTGFGLSSSIPGTCDDCGAMNSYFTTSFVPCETCVQGNCLTCSVYGVCTKCAFGYRPSGIDMNCIPCVSDQQFNSPEGVACVNCTLAGGCTACNMASGNCISCPAGNTTEGTGCVDCSWGTWSHAGQPACTSCAMGECTWCTRTGICTECNFGFEPSGTDMACLSCNNGTQWNWPSGQDCVDCTLGGGCQSCDMATGECTSCPEKTFFNSVSCMNCSLGDGCLSCEQQYGLCTLCPAGNFISGYGCNVCSTGTFSNGSSDACTPCQLYNGCLSCDPTNGLCTACPNGTFLAGVGCADCSLDGGCTSCDVISGLCTSCPALKKLAGTGCDYCFLGGGCRACDQTGACTSCPEGTYALGDGCVGCPSGTWNDGNYTLCETCVLGGGCLACDQITGDCNACPTGRSPRDDGCIENRPPEQVSSGSKPRTGGSLGVGAIAGIAAGCAAVAVAAIIGVLFLVLRRRRRPKKAVSFVMPGIEMMPEENAESFGISLEPKTLTFGAAAMQIPTDKEVHEKLVVTGHKKKEVTFYLVLPDPNPHKFTMKVEPDGGVVKPGVAVEIDVSLTLLCTTKFQSILGVVLVSADKKKKKARMNVSVQCESQLSMKLDATELEFGELVGSGSFGTVSKGNWRGQLVAIKSYNPTVICDPTLRGDIEREVAMCTTLRSPFIVTFFGQAVLPDKFFIVMEFVPCGSLGSVIKKNHLDEGFKARICLDTARGMDFLHRNNIIHRDLKTDNTLVVSMDPTAPVVGKLSDFNTSRFSGADSSRTKTKGIGTPIFMAPEILASEKYDWHADVYSFGVMLWNVWTQKEPYAEGFENQFAIYKFVGDGKRLPLPPDMPPLVCEVTQAAWAHDPSKRPTFEEIVQKLEQVS